MRREGEVERAYEDGRLARETPMRDGRKHGVERTWFEGHLEIEEPYEDGQMHGVARQYANGRVVGTYRMVHGTGLDVWRDRGRRGWYVCEVHTMRDGAPHGGVWMVCEDGRRIWHERQWWKGKWHGIERSWSRGQVTKRYFVANEEVDRRTYIAAAAKDPTLPPNRAADDRPWRTFPPEVRRVLARGRRPRRARVRRAR